MKYGIREICDVVLRAKSNQKIGNKVFYKDEPVCYFDSLKTSSLEGAATTVYAQGGRGNARLVAWEGERTVTFTMEDALISTEGLALLTGAGIIEPSIKEEKVWVDFAEGTIGINPISAYYSSPVPGPLEELSVLCQSASVDPILDPEVEYFLEPSQIALGLYSVRDLGIGSLQTLGELVQVKPLEELGCQILDYTILTDTQENIATFSAGDLGPDGIRALVEINIAINEDIFTEKIEISFGESEGYTATTEYPITPEGYAVALIVNNTCLYSKKIIKNTIPVHITEVTDKIEKTATSITIIPSKNLSAEPNAGIYIMPLLNGNIITEPYIGKAVDGKIVISSDNNYKADLTPFEKSDSVLLDYHTDKDSGVQQIEITPDKFGGNYYLEASTLFRDTNGVDMPAEFIIPNCKIQSNFTFSMASSGDPSTFTFTMDAFPDYTRFDKTKKVLSVIQVITDSDDDKSKVRKSTDDSLSRV